MFHVQSLWFGTACKCGLNANRDLTGAFIMSNTMRLIMVLLSVLLVGPTAVAQTHQLPAAAVQKLNRRFPGWKFAEPSAEVQQFFKDQMKGESPVAISGDFDGNRKRDYAVLIRHGSYFNTQRQPIGPRYYLIVFLRRDRHYKMHVIKNPDGEYLCLAKKGTCDYSYDEQKEITYANDAILTCIFEKAGSSYVYKNGKFVSFISSD